MLIACDDQGVTGLWFEGQKYFAAGLDTTQIKQDHPICVSTKQWLDIYFTGNEPYFMPPLHCIGTPFQLAVWNHLMRIPFGNTTTYGELSRIVAEDLRLPHMSPQAIGGAVGHNKIAILIPCHRVVGANGSLTGYAGGIEKKTRLLKLEGVDVERFKIPIHGTAR